MTDRPERNEPDPSLLSRILEIVPGGIVTVGPDGGIRNANEQAQAFLGLSWDALTGRFIVDFAGETFNEDGSPCPVEDYPVARCLATGEAQPPRTIGVRQPDGSLRWAIFTALPLELDGGGRGAVVTFVDISERRRKEAHWRARTRLVDRVRVVHLHDNAGGVLSAFEEPLAALLELTDSTYGFIARVDREAPLDGELTIQALVDGTSVEGGSAHPPLPLDRLSRRALVEGSPVVEREPGRLGGAFKEHAPSVAAVFPLRSNEEPLGLVGLAGSPRRYDDEAMAELAPLLQGCADLLRAFDERADRDRLRAKLAQTERLASVGTLAAGMAHEVNNPLAYVVLNLEALERHADELDGQLDALRADLVPRIGVDATDALLEPLSGADGLLARIHERGRNAAEGAERVRRIVRDLMAFARVTEEHVGPVDVNAAIDVALKMAHHEIKYRARLVRDLGDLPATRGHDGRLSQVFLNLLLNAARAIEEGRPEENEIRVRSWSEGGSIHVEVADTGEGVEPEHLDRLFEPFFSTRARGVGAGLGLSICDKVVRDHGGRIQVESVRGEGSRFEVILPVGAAPRASAAPPPEADAPTGDEEARQVMLLVDDEPMVRRILAHLLRRSYEVVVAGGLEEVRVALREHRVDLVLCDMMMLDGTGVDVHAHVQAHHPELADRMLFMTGGTFTPRARAFLAERKAPHLRKPFSLEELEAAVRAMLG